MHLASSRVMKHCPDQSYHISMAWPVMELQVAVVGRWVVEGLPVWCKRGGCREGLWEVCSLSSRVQARLLAAFDMVVLLLLLLMVMSVKVVTILNKSQII